MWLKKTPNIKNKTNEKIPPKKSPKPKKTPNHVPHQTPRKPYTQKYKTISR